MDTQTKKIDELTEQVWDAQNQLLQAQNRLSRLKKERNEALVLAGYHLAWQDNYVIWCHPDYYEIIKESIIERGFKDDTWIENEGGITLPSYASYAYMA